VLRWKAAACMWSNETDDFEQAGVQECLAEADPQELAGKTACEQNLYWKRKICAGLAERKLKNLDACVADKTFIPRIVEFGAGG
jgi:hypothetical protein